ncbi:hypothetical protein NE237_020201 [Protea cynaroides]|uniref:Uncharacterized protein n=1 Tax=Protea cynaroides TaxID=273540 RepID=A0A9Q0H5J2_9MAGN|nr:hypothetical protein NE237_020201 [Protea cynaroides]
MDGNNEGIRSACEVASGLRSIWGQSFASCESSFAIDACDGYCIAGNREDITVDFGCMMRTVVGEPGQFQSQMGLLRDQDIIEGGMAISRELRQEVVMLSTGGSHAAESPLGYRGAGLPLAAGQAAGFSGARGRGQLVFAGPDTDAVGDLTDQ